MTQTTAPTFGTADPGRRRAASQKLLSLHGADPVTGFPVTWHVTSLTEDGAPDTYLVERADGDIRNPAVWMQAKRDPTIVGEAEVLMLVRQVLLADS